MKNKKSAPIISIYVIEQDKIIIKKAARLLKFYEDLSLGKFLLREAEKIVEQYKGTKQ